MDSRAITRHLPALGIILIAGAAARTAWVCAVHPDPTDGRFDDTVWYRGAAEFLARGEGYLNPFSGTPTAAWPPGYPFFLGAVFKAFGAGTWPTYGANIALSLLTIVVVYAIALRLFDARTGAIAAAALALWPGQIYFSSLTLSEPLFTLVFSLALLVMLIVPASGRTRVAALVAFGAVTGAAVLTRGQAAMLLPLAVGWWWYTGCGWRRAIASGMLAAAVVAAMLAPWVIRNERALGSPVIIATNVGPNVWIGHHEGATGRMQIPEPEPPLPERGDKTQGEFEVAADSYALRKGLGWMVTHPAEELRLSAFKVRALYESDSTALDWNSAYGRRDVYASQRTEDTLRGLANGFWFSALALAGAGVVASLADSRRAAMILPATVLLWTAAHLLFFGDVRFHYPIVLAIALLGGRGVVAMVELVRRPAERRAEGYATA